MNARFFHIPDGPELRSYLEAEELVIERMLELSASLRDIDPPRSVQLRVIAETSARELLAIRGWFDL